MILLDHVSKEFHKKSGVAVPAIHSVSLHIPEGTVVGVIGASGSGKTTFLKLMAGLLQPSSGRVRVEGRDPVVNRKKLRGQIHMLSAEYGNLDTERSLEENLAMVPLLYSLNKKVFDKTQADMLTRFGLYGKKGDRIKDLSLGFRRRSEIVMALLMPAKVILFDEPYIGMDAEAKKVFTELVLEEKERGRTILVSSHDLGEIRELSDRILLMHQGSVHFYGEKEQLYRNMAPENRLSLNLDGAFPDLQDLPYVRYEQNGDRMILTYDSRRVTAAELLQGILQSGAVAEVSVIKPELSEVVTGIASGNEGMEEKNEFYSSRTGV